MKKYIGTKMIEAEKAFKIGDVIYSNENNEIDAFMLAEGQVAQMGYKVRYPDGYESFIPKKVFEKAYLPLEENKKLKTDAPSISEKMVEDFIEEVYVRTEGEKTTVVRAVLVNGFEIVESSSCVSEENYDESLGYEICVKKIKEKVWFLLGFLLQTAVHGIDGNAKAADAKADVFAEKDKTGEVEIHILEDEKDGFTTIVSGHAFKCLAALENALADTAKHIFEELFGTDAMKEKFMDSVKRSFEEELKEAFDIDEK